MENKWKNLSMIEVDGLVKHFQARKTSLVEKPLWVKAVDSVSFSIDKGETLGIVGESGSGKTTAARSMLRLIKPDSGRVMIDGTNVSDLSKKDLRAFRKNMQIVFQDPYGSLNPRISCGSIITEPLRIHTDANPKKIRGNLLKLLSMVGLQEDQLDRYPHEFSGGQRQRIGIARAIALEPKFLVLDEPVSALDASIQGQILNLLKNIQAELSLTYLFISHDLAVIRHMCDRIAVMYLGKIVEINNTDALFKQPLHPYTKSLIQSTPDFMTGKRKFSILKGEIPSPENPPSGCHFHPRCPQVMDICRHKYPGIISNRGTKVACHLY
jgi:oligopeptide transport system ATP-binding protein